MYHVYCIVSVGHPDRRYVGFSEDIAQRLMDHNDGSNPSTAPFRPWKLKGCITFDSKSKALEFERYLKSGSGHAFARKRLW